MSSLFKSFAMDTKKESEGVEVTFDPNEDGSVPTFIISRMGDSNKEYVKALEHATRPHRRKIELKTLSEAVAKPLFMNVFVTTVLRGWSNVQDKDGKDIAYNKDAAIWLFTELPELYKELQEQATSITLFRDESLEEESKN